MTQAVGGVYAAADYLGLPETTVRARMRAGTFPKPDSVEHGVNWWEISTLDKYKRKLARKKRKR